MKETRFKTSYSAVPFTQVICKQPSKALPDLTFTIKELTQRFQVDQLLLYNKQAQAMFDIKDDKNLSDSDFDRPSVNLPKNFDLVDSYNASKKFVEVRTAFKKSIKDLNKRKADEIYKKKVADEIKASESKTE